MGDFVFDMLVRRIKSGELIPVSVGVVLPSDLFVQRYVERYVQRYLEAIERVSRDYAEYQAHLERAVAGIPEDTGADLRNRINAKDNAHNAYFAENPEFVAAFKGVMDIANSTRYNLFGPYRTKLKEECTAKLGVGFQDDKSNYLVLSHKNTSLTVASFVDQSGVDSMLNSLGFVQWRFSDVEGALPEHKNFFARFPAMHFVPSTMAVFTEPGKEGMVGTLHNIAIAAAGYQHVDYRKISPLWQ